MASDEVTSIAAAASPPAAVAITRILGIEIGILLQYATLFYVLAATGYACWKWHKEWKAGRADHDASK